MDFVLFLRDICLSDGIFNNFFIYLVLNETALHNIPAFVYNKTEKAVLPLS